MGFLLAGLTGGFMGFLLAGLTGGFMGFLLACLTGALTVLFGGGFFTGFFLMTSFRVSGGRASISGSVARLADNSVQLLSFVIFTQGS